MKLSIRSFKAMFDTIKGTVREAIENRKKSLLAARDMRRHMAFERETRRLMTAAGSRATSAPKGLAGARRGTFTPVRPFSDALDTTPHKHTHMRLTSGKRRPRIKRLNKQAGRFEYLPAFREVK
jgi:hypothetical protein